MTKAEPKAKGNVCFHEYLLLLCTAQYLFKATF